MEPGFSDGDHHGSGGTLWSFAHKRVVFYVAIFLFELAVFIVLPATPFMPGEQQSYTHQAQQLGNMLSGATFLQQVWAIFSNNLRVGLVEMVPGLGAVAFGASLYETARVTEAIALTQNMPAVLIVLVLFVLPHSWIELSAYAVATGEGIILLYSLLRWLLKDERWRMRMELQQLGLAAGLVVAILLVAAVFEVTELQLGVRGLVMWLPFGLIAAFVLLLRRRILRVKQVALPQPPPQA